MGAINISANSFLTLNDINDVWKSFDGNKRNEINSANKLNYSLTHGDFDKLFELYKGSMIRQSHSFVEKNMLESIFNESKKRNCGEVFTLYDGNESVASLFIVYRRKACCYLWDW